MLIKLSAMIIAACLCFPAGPASSSEEADARFAITQMWRHYQLGLRTPAEQGPTAGRLAAQAGRSGLVRCGPRY